MGYRVTDLRRGRYWVVNINGQRMDAIVQPREATGSRSTPPSSEATMVAGACGSTRRNNLAEAVSRPHALTATAAALAVLLHASGFAQEFKPLDDDWAKSARSWGCIPSGLIAFVVGATPSSATGIPIIANFVRLNLTFKMGPGGAPCVRPSPFEREHWNSLIDNPLSIEEYTSTSAADGMKEFCQEHGTPDLLILVGHSAGANAVAKIATYRQVKRTTDLLILIDPYPRWFAINPGTARRVVNFYTDRGPAGIHGAPIVGAENIFLGGTCRCPLKDCSQGVHHIFDHQNIDDCDWVKRRVFELIQAQFSN